MYYQYPYPPSPVAALLDRWERSANKFTSSAVGDSKSRDGVICSPQDTKTVASSSVELQEFLDEEELIAECRSDNPRLLDYLCQPEILSELLRFAIDTASVDVDVKNMDDDTKTFRKRSFYASEVLAAELPRLTDSFLALEGNFDVLLKFLREKPGSLHPVYSSYFAKIVTALLRVRHKEVLDQIRKRDSFFPSLLSHLSVSCMAELLVRMTDNPEAERSFGGISSNPIPPPTPSVQAFKLLSDFDVLVGVTDVFVLEASKVSEESQYYCECVANSAHVLMQLTTRLLRFASHHHPSPDNLNVFKRPEIVGKLLDAGLRTAQRKDAAAALSHALQLAVDLLVTESSATVDHTIQQHSEPDPSGSNFTGADYILLTSRSIVSTQLLESELCSRFEGLLSKLSDSGGREPLINTTGSIDPPLGSSRLRIAEFFLACLRVGSPSTIARLEELGVPAALLSLLEKHRWSSILHGSVSLTICAAITQRNARVLESWIRAGLIGLLTRSWSERKKEQMDVHYRTSIGYMGQVISITGLLNDIFRDPESDCYKAILLAPEGDREQFLGICDGPLQETIKQLKVPPLGSESKMSKHQSHYDASVNAFNMSEISRYLPPGGRRLGIISHDDMDDEAVPLEFGDPSDYDYLQQENPSLDHVTKDPSSAVDLRVADGPTEFHDADGDPLPDQYSIPDSSMNEGDGTDSSDGDGTFASFHPRDGDEPEEPPIALSEENGRRGDASSNQVLNIVSTNVLESDSDSDSDGEWERFDAGEVSPKAASGSED
eukprot:CAMPEP_0184678598 /NCGR_PEP_ID=MMETSP0312-20130426/1350_1 /TAXON_ID=31354 /ORGANISM="Compsopogon coeruleus, Strain SAG 36.94" /LENGTH=775 /DNA_ID=CAMNT_0027127445 /DNA_START=339 /DNA_END=2666 /DNA_ORIENTATION=-